MAGKTRRVLMPAAHRLAGAHIAAIIGFAGMLALAGCGESTGSPGPTPTGTRTSGASAPPSPSAQVLTQLMVKQDLTALDRGVLTYRLPNTVRTSQPFTLKVTITDVGKGKPGVISATEASRRLGLTVFPKDIPTGAFVGLTIVSCANLTCHPLNPRAAQPIISAGSSQTWGWQITPGSPGPASLVINATTFEGQSTTSLSQVLVPISMKVMASTGFAEQQRSKSRHRALASAKGFLDTTTGLITSVGGAVAVLAGGFAWVSRQLKRRKKRRPKSSPHNGG